MLTDVDFNRNPSTPGDRRPAMRNPSANRLALAVIFLSFLASKSPISADEKSPGQTQVFGVTSSGSRFVYVFDRSLSMQGAPLAAVKRELQASLARLQPVHQFQVIFYNERPRIMRLDPSQPAQMMFADESGFRAAESFVGGITAAGGTDHVAALKMALRINPDVVFFLTDADDPALSKRDLDEIQRANNGTLVHAIEFKNGPDQGKGEFLRKLAGQNGGQYKYVDVTTLPANR
jgi:von Willebrand factor type A domain